MQNMTDRKGFLAGAASAVGATGIIASQKPANALPATGRIQIVLITDEATSRQDFIQDLEWHLGPGGFSLMGFSVNTNGEFALLGRPVP